MKSVLLYSGGIDSFLARHVLSEKGIDFQLVYCQLATRYGLQERVFLDSRKFPIMYLTGIYSLGNLEQSDAYIPNRNVLIASYVAAGCDCDTIYIGGTASDRVSDNNQEVMDLLSKTLSLSLQRDITVTSPFWNSYKTDLCQEYAKTHSPQDLLLDTFSCYTPNMDDDEITPIECLNCKACFRKNVSLFSVGITRPFANKAIIKSYLKDFESTSDSPRKHWTIQYINYITHAS